jgi:mRNA-degrading endonuclease RelE of RelBE toxin-antitoxin system
VGLTVIYRETAAPGLSRLRDEDKAVFARARSAIRALAADPYPDSAVPWGGSGFYRLHDGAIRITYEVDEAKRAVYILHLSVVPRSGR